MVRSSRLAATVAILFGVAACGDHGFTSPSRDGADLTPVPSSTLASANSNCSYTPSGEISIPVGSSQTFIPSSFSDCANAYVVIQASAPNVLGHLIPAGTCTVLAKTVTLFKVKKCIAGSGVINVYTNSGQSTLLQTIGVDREL